jgi:hypothetical protein
MDPARYYQFSESGRLLNGVSDLGVQIVMFDSSHGRTCLHYAAYYGHADCLRTILSAAAKSAPVSESWLAFVAPAVSPLLSGPFANVFSAVEVQGVRALRERAGRHRSDAAAPRGEAGLAALRPRPTRERRHRVCFQWRLRVRIPALPCPAAPLTLPYHVKRLIFM